MDEELRTQLRQAYDLKAEQRNARETADWRKNLRDQFAALLLQEQKQTLLELGAGPGIDGRYFQEMGLDVLCTDLSPEMVRLCRAKGLKAQVMDNSQFDLPPASFDAVYAMNSLLHLPKSDLPAVLRSIQTVLKPDGLFFIGVYGGVEREGIWEEDDYDPKRFFAFYPDDQLKQILTQFFTLVSFTVTPNVDPTDDVYHQSAVLRQIQ
jgi:SAM-dependent methyltransferase